MITLYTTDCPQCMMLEGALKRKRFSFDVVKGEQPILDLGFSSAPVLKVDDTVMSFAESVRWVNAQPSPIAGKDAE